MATPKIRAVYHVSEKNQTTVSTSFKLRPSMYHETNDGITGELVAGSGLAQQLELGEVYLVTIEKIDKSSIEGYGKLLETRKAEDLK